MRIRQIKRELTQTLILPYDTKISVRDQCENELINRMHNVPSTWGIMVADKLDSLRVHDQVELESYGPSVYRKVPVQASFTLVGLIPGDVLFGINIAEKVEGGPLYSAFRKVDVPGLPLHIMVKTLHNVSRMNIRIIKPCISGVLQYIAEPTFFPMIGPAFAHLADVTAPIPLYEEDPPNPKGDFTLIDPFHGLNRPALMVEEARLAFAIEGKTIFKTKESKTEADNIIRVVQLNTLKTVIPSLKMAYSIMRPMSMEPFEKSVLIIEMKTPNPKLVQPSPEQVDRFIADVENMIRHRKLEMISNNSIYKEKASAGLKADLMKQAEVLRHRLPSLRK